MKVRLSTTVAVAAFLAALGCGGPSAVVTGRVTCQGKPVAGIILFSPKAAPGDEGKAAAPSVSGALSETGAYELRLSSIGKHTVVVTPSDVVLRPKPGMPKYPCDLAPLERDIVAGNNEIVIELGDLKRP